MGKRERKLVLSGEQFVPKLIEILSDIHKDIHNRISHFRDDSAFDHQFDKARNKRAISIDIAAENTFKSKLLEAYPEGVVVGEESMENFQALSRGKIYVVCDIIDGTDLLEMDIPLWCSAVSIFTVDDTDKEKMLCSVVKLASGATYYAGDYSPHAFVKPSESHQNFYKVRGPSAYQQLSECTVSFYGQKISSLLETIDHKGFRSMLEYLNSTGSNNIRVHTLSGNPAMVLLADRESDNRRGFDIIMSLRSQKPHDVVAGAYIALKSGACMFGFDGTKWTKWSEIQLAKALRNPGTGIIYFISANEAIAEQILQHLEITLLS